ncbi:hypothetical protein OIU85_003229 [Salix viminalis]|uniref:CRA domain-containing protein n=1 Tax=Salix viminalis TaxID=40686 RepID=A0A9Q0PYP4_SALVM|nr:hypothetical protein OIU85_003229 [Salix viminalis]
MGIVGALGDAVTYGRIELAKFFKLPPFDDLVRDCVALLAYEQPQKCSAGYLLEDSQREIVADAVKRHDFINRSQCEGFTKLLAITSGEFTQTAYSLLLGEKVLEWGSG